MTTETSYRNTYAPLVQWAVQQAPVPQTVHNLPGTVPANGLVSTSLIVTEGFSMISAGLTSTQAGTLSIQRYLDAGGTVAQGPALSTAITANTAVNLDILDGKPFASFVLKITNSSSSVATIGNFALLTQAGANDSLLINSLPVAGTNPLAIYDGFQNPITSSWTSATALNTSFIASTAGYDTVVLTYVPTGAITGGVMTFEVYDGVNWLPVKAARVESYATDGTYALSGTSRGWQIPVAGFPQFRARLSTVITGSGTAGLTIITSSAPDTSVVTVGIDPATVVAVSLTGNATSDGSTTLTAGGTAQTLFSGTTPANGYSISNPDPVNDLWVSDSTTAAVNGLGSIRVASNGGYYATEPGQKPLGVVSIIGPATAQKITARRW